MSWLFEFSLALKFKTLFYTNSEKFARYFLDL